MVQAQSLSPQRAEPGLETSTAQTLPHHTDLLPLASQEFQAQSCLKADKSLKWGNEFMLASKSLARKIQAPSSVYGEQFL